MSNLQGKKILIIDDDPDLLDLAKLIFLQANAEVYTASSGREGLRQFYAQRPDLVVVDLMMPEMDGWQVCRNIRQICDTPIIILTALHLDQDVIRGLECGADEFVSKPTNFEVLLARVQALLRRTAGIDPTTSLVTYSDGYLTIDLNKRQVLIRGETLKLSRTEYRLLAYLVQNAGQVLTVQQILDKVWGDPYRDTSEYVHAYVWRLRQKLEPDPRRPTYLVCEHGVGYRFEKSPP